MRFPIIAAAAALLLTTGCHGVDSSVVDTEDMKAHLTLTATGNGHTDVNAELKPLGDSMAYVDLVSGEQLRVHARGLDRRLSAGWFDYHADVPTDRGGTPFQIRLERVFGSHAPDSWVELPAGFEFYRMPGVWSLTLDTLPIEWDRITDDPMHLSIEGDCISDYERTLPAGRDNGVWLIRPGQLRMRDHWDGGTCVLEVKAERVRRGRLDPAFAGGFIEARQQRSMEFVVEY